MGIRIYKPITPGRRKSSVSDFKELAGVQRRHKPLLLTQKRQAGRNVQGRITVRHRGGGHKRSLRLVDFLQIRYGVPAKVLGIQYDPTRSARLALIEFPDKQKSYVLAPADLRVDQSIIVSPGKVDVRPGNRTQLANIPTGVPIHNIELTPGKGGAIARSAGSAATLMTVEGDYALVKMPSGEIRKIAKKCYASIGQLSNIDHGNIRWGKAGRMRWRGFRPTVRGKAMNPVDHPHGGGEGKHPIGLKYPKTPWGKHALGVRTRRKKKFSRSFIISRRRK